MKHSSKKTFTIVALAALLLTSFGKVSHATVSGTTATGNTSISITLPNIIILHYLSDVSLSFNTDISTGVDEGAGSWNTSWSGTTSNGTGELAGSGLSDAPTYELDGNSTINVTLPKVWAVRGISSNGTATVSIAQGNTSLANTQSDSIELSNLTVSTEGAGPGVSITADLDGLSKQNATIGNVGLTMDLASANTSGQYVAAGAEYTITATAI